MTQFNTGEQKTATALVSNPTIKGFDYDAVLFLGVDAVVSSTKSFHLDAGESRNVSFPIVMPSTPGAYPVYLSVSSGGVLLVLYQAEDVVAVVAEPTGSLTGIIRHSGTGSRLQGVLVTIVDSSGRSYSAYTNDLGHYYIYNVPQGRYTLTCRKAGYTTPEGPITVNVVAGYTQRRDVNMSPLPPY